MAGRATQLAAHCHGFEILVGPYSVAELRVSQQTTALGGSLPADGAHVYLTDTLESPFATPAAARLFYAPLAQEHERARKIKEAMPILVCLGNPPYDRHDAGEKKGGWVRYGDDHTPSILEDILEPARKAGHGVHLKNLYNLYVYFWRWALWKVFEHLNDGPGIASFITAASYLDGPAFVGLRQHMRSVLDELWIIDVGGEGRGARRSENVFAIQTPVAIAIGVRYGAPDPDTPATVHYSRVEGTRSEKLTILKSISDFSGFEWKACPDGWQDPFRPGGEGEYFTWPEITNLFPWQHTGVEIKRTWPIAPDTETLRTRWKALLSARSRKVAYRETRDRKIDKTYREFDGSNSNSPPLSRLTSTSSVRAVSRYAYRSLDRQWVIVDGRLADYPRPPLWAAHSDQQLYLTGLLTMITGGGPALTAAADVPDRHHFSGRGQKDVIPLWRDKAATKPNITGRLLLTLESSLGVTITPGDLMAYCYGVVAHPLFTERYGEELTQPPPRVPLTKDADLFGEAVEIGRELIWLHTYGERFVPAGRSKGAIPKGIAKNIKAVPGSPTQYPETSRYYAESQVLTVGEGEFAPVAPEVWAFGMSGLRVVPSWLGYRMKRRAGRLSSPLDEIQPERWLPTFTSDMLRLLWVIEATLALYPRQANLLDRILATDTFKAEELPLPTDEERQPPKDGTGFFEEVGQGVLDVER